MEFFFLFSFFFSGVYNLKGLERFPQGMFCAQLSNIDTRKFSLYCYSYYIIYLYTNLIYYILIFCFVPLYLCFSFYLVFFFFFLPTCSDLLRQSRVIARAKPTYIFLSQFPLRPSYIYICVYIHPERKKKINK